MSFLPQTNEQPTVIDDDNGRRLTFTFSVEGLTARDEMLFKGYVRLLDHMTEHHWQYHEPSALHRVDLLVCSEHVQPTRFLQNTGQLQALLQLGTTNLNRSAAFLTWPLKPNELENQLNRLGRLISAIAADTQSEDEPGTVPASFNDAAADTEASVSQYRLREWPKPTLMAVAGRMRLATLLIGKAMSLEEMVFRSALPLSVCERFLADMQTAGLLLDSESAASHDPARVAPPAKKLSLPAAQERQVELPAAKAVIQPGLIARIRMRFGIKSSGAN